MIQQLKLLACTINSEALVFFGGFICALLFVEALTLISDWLKARTVVNPDAFPKKIQFTCSACGKDDWEMAGFLSTSPVEYHYRCRGCGKFQIVKEKL